MSQVQFFYDDELITLQGKINTWLRENKDVQIIQTNMNSLGTPSEGAGLVRSEKYIFYIFYQGNTMAATMETAQAQEVLSVPGVDTTNVANLTN